LAEHAIFFTICQRLKRVVCGESKVFEKAEKAAEKLRKDGHPVVGLSIRDYLGALSISIATLRRRWYYIAGQRPGKN
jgi:hypothetical protein